MIIRYSQVPPVPEWRLRTLMKYEVDEVGSQSGGDVSADYRKLNLPDPEGERGEDRSSSRWPGTSTWTGCCTPSPTGGSGWRGPARTAWPSSTPSR